MKIAVAGAGLTGSYLYRLLVAGGHEVDLYDRPPRTKCGINPCAWGTSRGFAENVRAAGLDAATYVLTASDHVVMDQVRVKADIFTFDKQRLIRDLRQGATIRQGGPDFAKYDRIVDCTGVSRAFLPPVGDDVVLPCVQYRVRTEKPLENEIRLRAIGYSWCFPLSPNEYHVGCGSLVMDPRKIIKELGWTGNGSAPERYSAGAAERSASRRPTTRSLSWLERAGARCGGWERRWAASPPWQGTASFPA